MTALTKAEMADHLSELTSLNRREAKQMVELFLRRDQPGANLGRTSQAIWFRQLRAARQAPAPGPQSENG